MYAILDSGRFMQLEWGSAGRPEYPAGHHTRRPERGYIV